MIEQVNNKIDLSRNHKIPASDTYKKFVKLLTSAREWILKNDCCFLIRDGFNIKAYDKVNLTRSSNLLGGDFYIEELVKKDWGYFHEKKIISGSFSYNVMDLISVMSLSKKKKFNKLYYKVYKNEDINFIKVKRIIRFMIKQFDWNVIIFNGNKSTEAKNNWGYTYPNKLSTGQFGYVRNKCKILDIINSPVGSVERELKFSEMVGGFNEDSIRFIEKLNFRY